MAGRRGGPKARSRSRASADFAVRRPSIFAYAWRKEVYFHRTMIKQPSTLGAFSVSLAVKDLSASRAFYEKLGFAGVGGNGKQWLKYASWVLPIFASSTMKCLSVSRMGRSASHLPK